MKNKKTTGKTLALGQSGASKGSSAIETAANRPKLARSEAEPAPFLGITGQDLLKSTGVRSPQVATKLAVQACQLQENGEMREDMIVPALGMLREIAPSSALEAMLAVQMIGVHNAAIECMARSRATGQTVGGMEANIVHATSLMRVFMQQTETMAKLRGTAGRQKMTVEHVHVHAGGQAIVGPVERGKGNPSAEGEKA